MITKIKQNFLKMIDSLRGTKIAKRFLIIFVAICGIPLLIIGTYTASVYKHTMEQKFKQASTQTLFALNKYVSTTVRQCIDYSYQIIGDESIQNILEKINNNEITSQEAFRMLDEHLDVYIWSQGYANMVLLNAAGEGIFSYGFAEFSSTFYEDKIDELNRQNIHHQWTSAVTSNGENVVVFTKIIYSEKDHDRVAGYINFIFNEKKFFRELYDNVDFGGESHSFIVGKDLCYLSDQYDSSNLTMPVERDNPKLAESLQLNKTGSVFEKFDGIPSLLIWDYNSDADWWMVTAVPISYLREDINQMQIRLTFLLLLLILYGSGMILLICSTIVIPINNLIRYSNDIKEGKYNTNIEITGNDEITRLFEQQTEMVNVLIGLGNTIQKKNEARQKMEFQLLQSQINPHFMFNTLNIFKTIAEFNDVPAISNGIDAFSMLLRQTIVQKDDMITLEEELENVKSYFIIQEYKYISRFAVSYDVDESARKIKIPKLLLQPLVENCIVHGIREDKKLEIEISCKSVGEMVQIHIKDNGRGFDPNCLMTDEPKRRFNSFGVHNVKKRIQLIYGENSKFEIHTVLDEGTEVEIEIPAQEPDTWEEHEQ